MKKSNLEVPCKRNRFGYWNSCKRLPNFINVAALVECDLFTSLTGDRRVQDSPESLGKTPTLYLLLCTCSSQDDEKLSRHDGKKLLTVM